VGDSISSTVSRTPASLQSPSVPTVLSPKTDVSAQTVSGGSLPTFKEEIIPIYIIFQKFEKEGILLNLFYELSIYMDIKDVTRKPQTKILHQQVALMVEKTFNITDHMLWSAKKNS
jgi:hypothetical protein